MVAGRLSLGAAGLVDLAVRWGGGGRARQMTLSRVDGQDTSIGDDTTGLKVGDLHARSLFEFDGTAHSGRALHALGPYEGAFCAGELAALEYSWLDELRAALVAVIQRVEDLEARENTMDEDEDEFDDVAGELEKDADDHYWRHLTDDGALEPLAVRMYKP